MVHSSRALSGPASGWGPRLADRWHLCYTGSVDDYITITAACERRQVHAFSESVGDLAAAGIRLVCWHAVKPGYGFLQNHPSDGLLIAGLAHRALVQIGSNRQEVGPGDLCWCPWELGRELRILGDSWEGLLLFCNRVGSAAQAGPAQWCRPCARIDSLLAAVQGILSELPHREEPGCLIGFSRTLISWLDRELGAEQPVDRGERLAGLEQAIHADPAADWSLERMASVLGVSTATARRWIHANAGIAPRDWLCAIRMRHAAFLLEGGHDPLKVIARAVGYSTPFSFSHAFKRHHGCSPQEYRRGHLPVP